MLGFIARGARIRFFFILLMLGGCAADSIVLAPAPHAADSGVLAFPTAGGLRRSGDGRGFVHGEPVSISGELFFPQGAGPFPAIVLAHGCNGDGNTERAWGPTLRAWGYATFVIDSFRPRGINEVCTNGPALIPLQRVPDAYGALRLLAAHPRIDSKRIALMGFSHGGALTMLASTAWAKETFAPAGQPAFRAFFPFYPNCNAEFPERRQVSAPVRIHTGEADDWTPAKPCAELAAALKAGGQDVAINVYAGAHHAFDQARRKVFLPNVNNGANCYPQAASILGPVRAGSVAGCVKKGATIAGDPAGAEQARRNLHVQLDELMK
ncbi:MAG: dienelactone hydrolase family protein [Betaproteobacteria bacterium]